MSCLLNTGYNVPCKSIAGIKKLYIAEYDSNVVYHYDNNGVINQIDNLQEYYEFELTRETASFTQQGEGSVENNTFSYTKTLEFSLTGLQQSLIETISELGRGFWTVILIDNNDRIWLIEPNNRMTVIASTPMIGRGILDLYGCVITMETKGNEPANEMSNTIFPPVDTLPLIMEFVDIGDTPPVNNIYDVGEWNTFLGTYTTPFNRVEIVGNQAMLYGGNGFILRNNLFSSANNLLKFLDNAGSVIETDNDCFALSTLQEVNFPALVNAGRQMFYGCTNIITISLPSLVSCGDKVFKNCFSLYYFDLPLLESCGINCFEGCQSLTTLNIPSIYNLGPTVGDDSVFLAIEGMDITLTVPEYITTCNGGDYDGDILYLIDMNSSVDVIII